MKNKPSCTLLIPTYNWPEALALVLKSVERQTVLPDEVMIADDGSGESTRKVIEQFQQHFPVPLHHEWQPDQGFQKTLIVNKALAKAKGAYIIQSDGDVLLHRHFVEDHLDFAEPNSFVAGTRVILDKAFSQEVLEKGILSIPLFAKGKKNFFNGIRSKRLRNLMESRYKNTEKNIYYIKGCNMAFWLKDFIKVNGYNESITGWGKEDSELSIRLYNAQVQKRYLKFGAIVYHLWHQEFSRDREQRNTDLMEKTIREKLAWCDKGIAQYL